MNRGGKMKQLFEYSYFPDIDHALRLLEAMAIKEQWSFTGESSTSYTILKNYLEHTFRRIKFENKIEFSSGNEYSCFNTGLMTPNYSYIYAFFARNRNPNAPNPYFFKKFFSDSDLGIVKLFTRLPDTTNFCNDPSLSLYNHLLPLQLNVDHIVDDNIERFPDTLKENKNLCRRLLNGAIEETKKRLLANYKLAVPHCYENRVQLLIPIYLTGEGNPDIALAIEKNKDKYYAITCLTMRMAYQNARLIVKPESSWLRP